MAPGVEQRRARFRLQPRNRHDRPVATEARANAAGGARSPAPTRARSDGARGHGWHERPCATDHTSGFVAAGSLAIAGRGLPDYEALRRPDGEPDIALTLLRCVGMLARDPPSCAGRAGPGIPTPDAQCQGVHRFENAAWSAPDETDLDLAQAAPEYRMEFEVGPAGPHPPPGLVLGPSLVFSSLKAAEDGDGSIIRGWNPEPVEVTARVETPDDSLVVERCRLDETALEPPPATVGVSLQAALRASGCVARCPAEDARQGPHR